MTPEQLNHIQEILADITYAGFSFVIDEAKGSLRVSCEEGTCNVSGKPLVWKGRHWLLSPHMTEGEIVQTAWLALQVAMEHEMRENFRYKGAMVFGPHFDICALAELAKSPAGIVERDHH
ncbi:hypothetical protein DBR00_02535 [Pseudomonas sp. HMWF032]|uniref:hypothetical protein n=1 Tax=Pseudomonas sp. HMWF032 TaxID=2056866 RepID=UPI000D34867B|nr:hypothetical protein [Pseudomonas sp. HMWF032]PTS86452.1 hypothetical protein DBR00_02535 [Pseudomonas sp. HMWF032]PTT81359.1 hypothetical protein DBR41_16995 [Pseudomonas sp. HMWF010]